MPLSKPGALPDVVEQARIGALVNEQGGLELFSPPNVHVLVTRATGHLTAAMAEVWVARTKPLFAFPQKLAVFNEWSAMRTYDSAARTILTDWVIEHRNHIEGAWFLTGSRLVAMGVAVAGTATAFVGVTMHASLRRPDWEALLDARLRSRP